MTALVAGSGCEAAAQAASGIAGIAHVLKADDDAYAHALAENVAPLVAGLMADYDAFEATATTTGKNISAARRRIARRDAAFRHPRSRGRRPLPGRSTPATRSRRSSTDVKLVITVRGTAFAKAPPTGGNADVEAVGGKGDSGLSSFVGALEIAKSGGRN